MRQNSISRAATVSLLVFFAIAHSAVAQFGRHTEEQNEARVRAQKEPQEPHAFVPVLSRVGTSRTGNNRQQRGTTRRTHSPVG